jgi:hypothetical protein
LDCAFSVCFVSLHFSHTFLAPIYPHPPPAQLVLDRHVLASLRHLDVRALLSNLPVNKAIAMLDAVQAHLARALNAHAAAADAAAEARAQEQATEALDPASLSSSSSSAPSSASSAAAAASAAAAVAALSEADALIAALRSHRAVILAALPDSIRASVIASRPPPTPTASTPASSATSASSAASASSVSLASSAAAAASAAPARSSALASTLPSTPTMTPPTPTSTTQNTAVSLTPVQPQQLQVSSGGAPSDATDDRGAVLSPPVASAPPASSESGDRPAFDLHVCENFF